MTLRECAIVEAYTGICMLTGDKTSAFYEYASEIIGRPVYTHEFASKEMQSLLKERSYDDFVELCREAK